ncbi:MAG: hypothetical protein QXX99_03795 [Candidatus Bathyarchaeia archaeon]
MEANFLLPISLFTIIALSILLHRRVAERAKEIFGERKISIREVIIIVIFMGILVTIIGLIPSYAIQILFIAALSYTLLIYTYLFSRKVIVSVIPPIMFIAAFLFLNYFLVENILVVILIIDIFSVIFAIIVTTLIGPLFSWKVIMVFAALLTAMDVIHVFMTGHMVEAAGKVTSLYLPLVLLLPRLPSLRGFTVLGLGDIFLSGLLSTYVASRYNPKVGLLTAASISIVFLAFDIIVFNFVPSIRAFPATLLVLVGWLLGMGPYILKRREKI